MGLRGGRVVVEQARGRAPRRFHQIGIAQRIGEAQQRGPRLARAEKFARAADLRSRRAISNPSSVSSIVFSRALAVSESGAL